MTAKSPRSGTQAAGEVDQDEVLDAVVAAEAGKVKAVGRAKAVKAHHHPDHQLCPRGNTLLKVLATSIKPGGAKHITVQILRNVHGRIKRNLDLHNETIPRSIK